MSLLIKKLRKFLTLLEIEICKIKHLFTYQKKRKEKKDQASFKF